MPRAYDRTRYYLKMGEFIKLIGFKGEKVFFRVGVVEPMGPLVSIFSDPIQGVGAAAAGHFGAAPQESDSQLEPFSYLNPVQELRLCQIRLTMFPVTVAPGVFPPVANIPPVIEAEYSSPATEHRAGTDRQQNITMNGIVTVAGGRDGGRLPGNQIRRFDDPNEVFDIFMVRGYEPAYRLANGTPFNIGAPPPATPYNFYWYIATQGRRYILGKVKKEELKGLISRRIPYRAITLGGITTLTAED